MIEITNAYLAPPFAVTAMTLGLLFGGCDNQNKVDLDLLKDQALEVKKDSRPESIDSADSNAERVKVGQLLVQKTLRPMSPGTSSSGSTQRQVAIRRQMDGTLLGSFEFFRP